MVKLSELGLRSAEQMEQMRKALVVPAYVDAIKKTSQMLKVHTETIRNAQVYADAFARTASVADALRSSLEPFEQVRRMMQQSRMMQDLQRMAELQQRMTEGLVEPIRRLQEITSPIFASMEAMRAQYEAFNESILKIDLATISSAADCVVAHAYGDIDMFVVGEGEVEIEDPKGILAPIIKDLKKNPTFAPLVVYATVLFTSFALAVIPNDCQKAAQEYMKVVAIGGGASIIVLKELNESWKKMQDGDDS